MEWWSDADRRPGGLRDRRSQSAVRLQKREEKESGLRLTQQESATSGVRETLEAKVQKGIDEEALDLALAPG